MSRHVLMTASVTKMFRYQARHARSAAWVVTPLHISHRVSEGHATRVYGHRWVQTRSVAVAAGVSCLSGVGRGHTSGRDNTGRRRPCGLEHSGVYTKYRQPCPRIGWCSLHTSCHLAEEDTNKKQSRPLHSHKKNAEDVRIKLDKERELLGRWRKNGSKDELGFDNRPDAIDHYSLEDTQFLTDLRFEAQRRHADDEEKRRSDDGLRLNAIQGGMPRSTSFTLALSLFGNVAIATAKLLAWQRTGHSAMLSEAVHTLVDVGNQLILGYGLREASKAPDSRYQYGYGRAAFFYSLVTALSTFGFGSVYTFYQGAAMIMYPPAHLETMPETWAVLAASFAIDGFVLQTAFKDVQRRAKKANITALQWVSRFKDPFTVAVVFEDGAAVLGVIVATAGIGLAQATGNPMWDGIASLCISGLLASVSLKLIALNRSFILGKPVSKELTDSIRSILMKRRSVDAIHSTQSQWIGPSAFAYTAEVDFDGTYLAAKVYQRYEQEIVNCLNKGLDLDQELKWLLPCFAEDITRVLESEVRSIQETIRHNFKEAAFIEIIPDSSQSTKLTLDEIGPGFKQAEQDVMMAILNVLPSAPTNEDSENHEYLFKLGKVYEAQGLYEKAISHFLSCIEERESQLGMDTGVAKVYKTLGSVYERSGDLDHAISAYLKAISIFEGDGSEESIFYLVRTLTFLGSAERKKRQYKNACRHLERALRLGRGAFSRNDPRLLAIMHGLADLYMRSPARVWESIQLLEELRIHQSSIDIDAASPMPNILSTLAKAYKNVMEYKKAENVLRELISQSEDRLQLASAQIDLADVLVDQCDRDNGFEALDLFEAALLTRVENHPTSSPKVYNVKNRIIAVRTSLGLAIRPDLYKTD